MKFIVLSCAVISVLAEPPRFRQARFRFQRQELAPTTDASPEPAADDAGPYPASGWKPAGQQFSLPTETESAADNTYGPPAFTLPQQSPPVTSYGAPDNAYGSSANVYGTPSNTYGAPGTGASEGEVFTDYPGTENKDVPAGLPKDVDSYYVLLPNGSLQKVYIAPKNDEQNMQSARLQLRRPASSFRFRL